MSERITCQQISSHAFRTAGSEADNPQPPHLIQPMSCRPPLFAQCWTSRSWPAKKRTSTWRTLWQPTRRLWGRRRGRSGAHCWLHSCVRASRCVKSPSAEGHSAPVVAITAAAFVTLYVQSGCVWLYSADIDVRACSCCMCTVWYCGRSLATMLWLWRDMLHSRPAFAVGIWFRTTICNFWSPQVVQVTHMLQRHCRTEHANCVSEWVGGRLRVCLCVRAYVCAHTCVCQWYLSPDSTIVQHRQAGQHHKW